MKRILIFMLAAAFFVTGCRRVEPKQSGDAASAPVAARADEVLDDGEDGCYWLPVLDSWTEWGNKYLETEFSAAADVTDEWSAESDYAIRFDYEPMTDAENASAHFYCTDILTTDWNGFSKLTMAVNNIASVPVLLQFYTKSGDGWQWSNTDAVEIAPGVSEVEFDISQNGVAYKEAVREMGLVIYGGTEKAALLIDNLLLTN